MGIDTHMTSMGEVVVDYMENPRQYDQVGDVERGDKREKQVSKILILIQFNSSQSTAGNQVIN